MENKTVYMALIAIVVFSLGSYGIYEVMDQNNLSHTELKNLAQKEPIYKVLAFDEGKLWLLENSDKYDYKLIKIEKDWTTVKFGWSVAYKSRFILQTNERPTLRYNIPPEEIDEWRTHRRKVTLQEISYNIEEDSVVALRDVPLYRSYSAGSAHLSETYKITDNGIKIDVYANNDYKTKRSRVVWELIDFKLPIRRLSDCEIVTGNNGLISWCINKEQVSYVNIADNKIQVFFKPFIGEIYIDPILGDITVVPDVILDSPENTSSLMTDATFTANITIGRDIDNCSIWHNISGTWELNQTNKSKSISRIGGGVLDDKAQSFGAGVGYTAVLDWGYFISDDPVINVTYGSIGSGISDMLTEFRCYYRDGNDWALRARAKTNVTIDYDFYGNQSFEINLEGCLAGDSPGWYMWTGRADIEMRADADTTAYWVQANCDPSCLLSNMTTLDRNLSILFIGNMSSIDSNDSVSFNVMFPNETDRKDFIWNVECGYTDGKSNFSNYNFTAEILANGSSVGLTWGLGNGITEEIVWPQNDTSKWVEPDNQTSTFGVYNITNNFTGPMKIQFTVGSIGNLSNGINPIAGNDAITQSGEIGLTAGWTAIINHSLVNSTNDIKMVNVMQGIGGSGPTQLTEFRCYYHDETVWYVRSIADRNVTLTDGLADNASNFTLVISGCQIGDALGWYAWSGSVKIDFDNPADHTLNYINSNCEPNCLISGMTKGNIRVSVQAYELTGPVYNNMSGINACIGNEYNNATCKEWFSDGTFTVLDRLNTGISNYFWLWYNFSSPTSGYLTNISFAGTTI